MLNIRFSSELRTPWPILVLLGVAAFFSLINFAGGWLVDIFPDMSRQVPGQLMVMANNGSRQLGAAVFFVLAILSRNPYFAWGALIIRVVGEALDVFLYGKLMPGMLAQAGLATAMLIAEIWALIHLWRRRASRA